MLLLISFTLSSLIYAKNDFLLQFGGGLLEGVAVAIDQNQQLKKQIDSSKESITQFYENSKYEQVLLELKNFNQLLSTYRERDRKQLLDWQYKMKLVCERKIKEKKQNEEKEVINRITLLQKKAHELAKKQNFKECIAQLEIMVNLVNRSSLSNHKELLSWSERLKTFCDSKIKKAEEQNAHKIEIEKLKLQLIEKDNEIKDLKSRLVLALKTQTQNTSNPTTKTTKATLPLKKTPQANIGHTGRTSAKIAAAGEKLDLPPRKPANLIVNKRLEQLKNEIDGGTDPNSMIETKYNQKITLLGNEVENGSWQTVEYLIGVGAIIEAPTGLNGFQGGANALQVACIRGDLDIIRTLIENGFDPNDTTQGQTTRAIQLAMNSQTPDKNKILIIKYLHANGAKVDYLNEEPGSGQDSFAIRAIEQSDPMFISFALNNNSPIDIKHKGKNILLSALANPWAKNVKSIETFLEQTGNAYLDDKDFFGDAPLNSVSWRNLTETARLFIKRGAEVNTSNNNGNTPIMGASRNGETELMKLLLLNGANVNAKNNKGKTSLHYASEEGEFQAVILLLKNNADRSAINNEGKTPIDLAKEKGNSSIIKAFEKY